MRPHNIIKKSHYRGMPINASMAMPVHGEILDKLHRVMLNGNANQARTMFIRFDLHFPRDRVYPTDNKIFSGFVNSFLHNQRTATPKRKADALNPTLFWVREKRHEAINHHHHCILMIDAKYSQRYMPHLLEAQRFWQLAVQCDDMGLVNFCIYDRWGNPQKNGIIWHRSDAETFRRCFYWGSYLAKIFSKGHAPPRVREYDCSRFN